DDVGFLVSGGACRRGGGDGADWAADYEHGALRAGPPPAAGADRGGGGAVYWRSGSGAGLPEPAGADGGEVRGESLPRGGGRAAQLLEGEAARVYGAGRLRDAGSAAAHAQRQGGPPRPAPAGPRTP